MDAIWERSIPRTKVSSIEVKSILNEFISCNLESYNFIDSGCRNSNYKESSYG
ncbi:hypothetical protein HLPCO_001682 [Haloplasma contractile SSD-17B]|uniref:Uncharacterized protein n=1 Tax=Haloplasma contractile SSD-17B TaxID=1033810 RepID=U2FH24_9MOLU|nr:hypothetical protein HLPCO_001682 [Haloplasma contractile SSD-17B]